MVTRRYKKIIAKAKYHSWDSLEFRDKWGTPDVIGEGEPRKEQAQMHYQCSYLAYFLYQRAIQSQKVFLHVLHLSSAVFCLP